MANYAEALSTKTPKAGPKKLEGVMVKKGAEGGHIVEHHFMGYEHKPEAHPFGEGEGRKVMQHVAKHMGISLKAKEGIAQDADDDGE